MNVKNFRKIIVNFLKINNYQNFLAIKSNVKYDLILGYPC